MNRYKILIVTSMLMVTFLFTGCARNRSEIWDDTKTCGRHLTRGFSALGGSAPTSRQVWSKDEFYWPADGGEYYQTTSNDSGYITFPEEQNSNEIAMAEFVAPQPKDSPGDPGSSVPGIDRFRDPSSMVGMGSIFQTIHFEYNSSLVKGTHNQEIVQRAASYLKKNPNTYVFVEGHCDERGPEAYNLALGARRANAVRNSLIKEGVSPDNIFTISYGKERPISFDNNDESWALNRRSDFKLYVR